MASNVIEVGIIPFKGKFEIQIDIVATCSLMGSWAVGVLAWPAA